MPKSKTKHNCGSGQRWSTKFNQCKVPCRKPQIRSYKYPFGCVTPKAGKKTGKRPSCSPTKSGRRRVHIKMANKCMTPCKDGKRRTKKSPYRCYKPKKRASK